MFLALFGYPTDPFTTFELQNPSHDVAELSRIRRSPDAEASKLRKVRSGSLSAPKLSMTLEMHFPDETFLDFKASKSVDEFF